LILRKKINSGGGGERLSGGALRVWNFGKREKESLFPIREEEEEEKNEREMMKEGKGEYRLRVSKTLNQGKKKRFIPHPWSYQKGKR